MVSQKAVAADRERIAALKGHLLGRTSGNPSTLARAYGLPEPTVSRVMREMGVAVQ